MHSSLFKVFKRCSRKKWNKSWIQLFWPLKKTVENCLKRQHGSNHIVLSPHLCFRKSGECWILKDLMVQLRTIRFTVFKWTIRFNRTIRACTDACCLRRHQNKNISFCFNTDFLMTLISSLDLINCWWLKLRANEPIVTLVFDTTWRNQNGGIFGGY